MQNSFLPWSAVWSYFYLAWYITLIKINRFYFCTETPNRFLNVGFGYKFKMQGSSEVKFVTVVFSHLNGTDEQKGMIAK